MSERKISETLIDFAKPIIEMIDKNTTQEQIEKGFMVAITVWNSLVFEVVKNDTSYLEKLRDSISGLDEEGEVLIEALIARKRKKFKDDLRAIGDHSITYFDGRLNVKAESRLVTGKGIN